MANSLIAVSQGSGKNLATYSLSEDATIKEVQRASLNTSTGAEVGTSGAPLRVDPTGSTIQPVSAASLPLPTGASTSAAQTDGSQKTKVVDGSGNVIGSTSNALDVNIKSGSVGVDTTGLATTAKQDTIIGHIDGIETLVGSTNTKLDTIAGHVDGTEGLLTTIDADTSLLAGTVSMGKVEVNIATMPTTTVDATGLDIRIIDANSDSISPYGSVGLLDQLSLANSVPATVAIVDGSGDQITSFGGGTQYTEGDTDASITGTAVMFETNTGTNALGVVNASNPLPVSASIDTTGLATDATDTNTGTIAGDTTSIDAKIPALGQALAAASVPVVLTAAQITTLTPPAAITGFATSAKQDTLLAELQLKADLTETQPVSLVSVPTHAVTATDLDIRNLVNTDVVTAELSAVDNAVLDTIAAKDFATQTTLAAINTKLVTGTDIGDVTINNASGASAVNIQDGGNTITVDGTVAVTNAGITTIAGAVSGTEMQVDVLTMPTVTVNAHAVTNAGTFATQVDGAALTALQLIDNLAVAVDGNYLNVNANIAGTDMVSGSGTATGALRVELPTNGTGVIATVGAVTSITNALPAGTNAIGKLAANSGVDIGDVTLTAGTAAIGTTLPPDIDVTTHTNYARKYYANTGAVTDGIIWSPAAGKRWHVVTLYIQVSAAATVTLEDDKSGGDDPVWKGELAANSGVTLSFTEHYPMASGEDAADLIITTSAGNIYVTAVGYEI